MGFMTKSSYWGYDGEGDYDDQDYICGSDLEDLRYAFKELAAFTNLEPGDELQQDYIEMHIRKMEFILGVCLGKREYDNA